MELSIIIVNYKTPKLTKNCVASIKKYPPKVPYEVIVIDNSIDNIGFAKANNKGIRKAKGKYIFLLNSDTEVKKDAIKKLLRFAKENEDAGVVAPKLLNPDGSVQASAFRFPTIILTMREYWFGERNLLSKYVPTTKTVEVAVTAAFLITPGALEKVGLLNEKFFMFFEEFDYCRRVKATGLKVYYLASAEVVHIHGASGKDLTDWANQWRRLIPSSKIYHGVIKHYIIFFIMWTSQKWQKLLKILS